MNNRSGNLPVSFGMPFNPARKAPRNFYEVPLLGHKRFIADRGHIVSVCTGQVVLDLSITRQGLVVRT